GDHVGEAVEFVEGALARGQTLDLAPQLGAEFLQRLHAAIRLGAGGDRDIDALLGFLDGPLRGGQVARRGLGGGADLRLGQHGFGGGPRTVGGHQFGFDLVLALRGSRDLFDHGGVGAEPGDVVGHGGHGGGRLETLCQRAGFAALRGGGDLVEGGAGGRAVPGEFGGRGDQGVQAGAAVRDG